MYVLLFFIFLNKEIKSEKKKSNNNSLLKKYFSITNLS